MLGLDWSCCLPFGILGIWFYHPSVSRICETCIKLSLLSLRQGPGRSDWEIHECFLVAKLGTHLRKYCLKSPAHYIHCPSADCPCNLTVCTCGIQGIILPHCQDLTGSTLHPAWIPHSCQTLLLVNHRLAPGETWLGINPGLVGKYIKTTWLWQS